MTVTIKHKFVSVNGEDPDASLVAENAWNDSHNVTADPGLVGRSPEGGSGPAQTIGVGAGLTLSGSVLSVTGGGGGSGSGATGPTGPPGPTGPSGPTGPQGPPGTGAVSSVSNVDGTLVISPTTGAVVASARVATSTLAGIVKPDNSTITISGGVISSTGGGGGGGALPTGGTASMVVARDRAGNGHWRRSDGSVNVEDFYPAGFATPHNGASQPLSVMFGTLAAAQAVYPLADDLTPEVDTCAIQAAIDYAYGVNLTEIYIPEGKYVISDTIFVDAPSGSRGISSGLPRWTPGATFASGAVVLYNGIPYISQQAGNTGHAPFYVASELGNDPWWKMYYIDAGPTGGTPSPINSVFQWSPMIRGESGHADSYPIYGTIFNIKYINMIAVFLGPGNGARAKGIAVYYPEPAYVKGGCNPRSVGFGVPGFGGGGSGTDIEDCSVTYAYSVIRYFVSSGGGLGDNNVVRRCSGGGTYRFLSYPNTQAYINDVYDCFPASVVGASGTPGVLNVYGGNWSAEQEGGPSLILSIAGTSGVTDEIGGGYWRLGDMLIPGASHHKITTTVTTPLGVGHTLFSNAYDDGRAGQYQWFVIVTPSFGPVPFIAGDVNTDTALNIHGAIIPGTGGPAGPVTFRNVSLINISGSGTGRIVDVTITGGGVTALSVINPGNGYVAGDVLSANSSDIGGCANFRVPVAQTLRLTFATHWLDTFISATDFHLTDLVAEIQAATTLYAAGPVFPFQCAVNADGVFFENANVSTCLLSVGGGFNSPSIFKSGFYDADPSLSDWSPVNGFGFNDSHLPHYYTAKTLPFIWMNGDVTFDACSWSAVGLKAGGNGRDPIVVYQPGGNNFKLKNTGISKNPYMVFWNSQNAGGPLYSSNKLGGAGLELIFDADYTLGQPTLSSTSASQWASQKSPVSGIRPSSYTVPSIQTMDLPTLVDPQNLPPVFMPQATPGQAIGVSGAIVNYPMPYGGMAYKTDFLSSGQLAAMSGGVLSRQSTTVFEGSHDLYSYFQHLTAHDAGGPGVILGLNWSARGQSWCVLMDQATLTFMFTGLVIGLKTDTLNYYIVTGVYPGLGYATVYKLNAMGASGAAAAWISGSNSTVYAGTADQYKIYAQPYRIRYLSAPLRSLSLAALAAVGEELMVDTSNASWVLSLPINPLPGDKVTWWDIGATIATNRLTLDGNGFKINASSNAQGVSANGLALYKDSTTGWVIAGGGTLTATAALLVTPPDNTAFGGQIGSALYPASFTYTLTASAAGSISYTITGIPAWLTPSAATSGTISASASLPVVFTPAVGALAPGRYTAVMTFAGGGKSTNRLVSLNVLGRQYAAAGDSITSGALTANGGYPVLYATAKGPNVTVSQFAFAGAFLHNLRSNTCLVDQVINMKRAGDRYVLSVMCGTNDACFSYTDGNFTSGDRQAFLSAYAAYLDHHRSKGWYVILCTQISRGQPNPTYQGLVPDTELAVLNTEFRTWAASGTLVPGKHADVICDFASIPQFTLGGTVYTNATYYEQTFQTHPTDAGQSVLEAFIAPFLDTGLGLSSNSFGTAAGTSTATGVPLTAFNPTSLFAGGQTGGWWDPSDFSTMDQDLSGTPVTAPNQPVAAIRDKSGNSFNLSSGGPPTLKTDGSGHFWLEFNGVANRMGASAAPSPISFPATRINALQQIAWVAYGTLFNIYPGGNWILQQNFVSPQVAYGSATDNNLTLGTNHVATEIISGASSSLTVDHNTTTTVSLTNPVSTDAQGLTIANTGFSSNFTNMRWYGGIVIGRVLTAPEIASCQTFFGAKAGLSL